MENSPMNNINKNDITSLEELCLKAVRTISWITIFIYYPKGVDKIVYIFYRGMHLTQLELPQFIAGQSVRSGSHRRPAKLATPFTTTCCVVFLVKSGAYPKYFILCIS